MREYRGLRYDVDADVYEPSDDSFLLVDAVMDQALEGRRVLEIGCGAGLASIAAARGGASVVAVDKNPRATRLARENARRNETSVGVVRGDLLTALRGSFDLLLFNPPYLPSVPADEPRGRADLDDAWAGGTTGLDVVNRLFDQLADRRVVVRELLLVTSSLQDESAIAARLEALGYAGARLRDQKFAWERLTVWKWALRR